MEDSDTAAILPEDNLSYADHEVSGNDSSSHNEEVEKRNVCCKRPPFSCPLSISVEPVLFLSMFSLALQMPLTTQYLWDRISEDLSYNGSKSGGCGNTSGSPDPLQKEVGTMTAHWNLYINLGGFLVSLFVVTLLGSWSDLGGRRSVLIIPSLGLALQAALYLVVMYLKLPVAWFLMGRLLSGLSGDFNTVLAGCFAYVADTSDRESRTFRVAVLEACLGLAGMMASLIGGPWRRAEGYIHPFWLALAANVAAAGYAYLFVPETVSPDPNSRFLTTRHYGALYRLYSTGGDTRDPSVPLWRCKLWLYTLCFFLVVTVHFGSRDLYVLFELSSPLCWGSVLIGVGSATVHLAYLSSLLGLKVMQRCLADSWVALVGLGSNMAGLVVISLASTTALMFTGYGLGFLFMASTPVLRAKLSKLVSPAEQGALFAAVACVESLCSLVASGLFNALYPATLHFMKGFPFLLAAILLLIPATIIGTIEYQDQKRNREDTTTS